MIEHAVETLSPRLSIDRALILGVICHLTQMGIYSVYVGIVPSYRLFPGVI